MEGKFRVASVNKRIPPIPLSVINRTVEVKVEGSNYVSITDEVRNIIMNKNKIDASRGKNSGRETFNGKEIDAFFQILGFKGKYRKEEKINLIMDKIEELEKQLEDERPRGPRNVIIHHDNSGYVPL